MSLLPSYERLYSLSALFICDFIQLMLKIHSQFRRADHSVYNLNRKSTSVRVRSTGTPNFLTSFILAISFLK